MDLSELSQEPIWPESTEELTVVHVPFPGSGQAMSPQWLAAPASPDAPLACTLSLEKAAVHWRPGRAMIEGKVSSLDEILMAAC